MSVWVRVPLLLVWIHQESPETPQHSTLYSKQTDTAYFSHSDVCHLFMFMLIGNGTNWLSDRPRISTHHTTRSQSCTSSTSQPMTFKSSTWTQHTSRNTSSHSSQLMLWLFTNTVSLSPQHNNMTKSNRQNHSVSQKTSLAMQSICSDYPWRQFSMYFLQSLRAIFICLQHSNTHTYI